ncbi:hypothetical protein KMW28_12490 [Flammeovirga yaeyamensis]|uniref:Lipoprotein n=1 Tax=Flammeovirga yaeyamensis TaxID=367791 RepID=A0AAX1N324_9BACT|nr:hypothetical protein [Flammeovirga yaeyamensis]MBB3696013.1 hypothetical protein [Flammeovirga yaeyamensis]NMF34699.1 hypothetical protein [Flammeovirga yaeyamensis]QWG00472.1 hypothetical protein KMW28_12490 [Flammeovirga yaeyamensis]
MLNKITSLFLIVCCLLSCTSSNDEKSTQTYSLVKFKITGDSYQESKKLFTKRWNALERIDYEIISEKPPFIEVKVFDYIDENFYKALVEREGNLAMTKMERDTILLHPPYYQKLPLSEFDSVKAELFLMNTIEMKLKEGTIRKYISRYEDEDSLCRVRFLLDDQPLSSVNYSVKTYNNQKLFLGYRIENLKGSNKIVNYKLFSLYSTLIKHPIEHKIGEVEEVQLFLKDQNGTPIQVSKDLKFKAFYVRAFLTKIPTHIEQEIKRQNYKTDAALKIRKLIVLGEEGLEGYINTYKIEEYSVLEGEINEFHKLTKDIIDVIKFNNQTDQNLFTQ